MQVHDIDKTIARLIAVVALALSVTLVLYALRTDSGSEMTGYILISLTTTWAAVACGTYRAGKGQH